MADRPYDRVLAKVGTQSKLVELAGCPQSTVSHWKESGTIPPKHQATILKRARAAGITIKPADFVPTPDEAA